MKKIPAIIVYVRGGVVQDVQKPKEFKDVRVEVHDYDTDDDTSPRIETDKDGEAFEKGVW